MIARPTSRLQPIPFAAPAQTQTPTRPSGYAASSPSSSASASASAHHSGTAPAASPFGARRSPVTATEPRPQRANGQQGAPRTNEVSAKFFGQGALSVRSSVTGRHYRFQGQGDCQPIDSRDILMLRRIPDLLIG